MNIVVIGQGAIGLLWYRQLAHHTDHNVLLKCSNRIKIPPEHYYFTDINGQKHQQALKLASNKDFNKADIVLFCVKSYQVQAALDEINNCISPHTALIFCHNGMTDYYNLASTQPCLSLLTTHACKVLSPFHIQHTGLGYNDIGLINGEMAQTTLSLTLKALEQALSPLHYGAQIQEKQWLKLAINCVINPLTTLYNIDNGSINEPEYGKEFDLLLTEVIAIARLEGVIFEFSTLKRQISDVAQKTAHNCSSMRSDILNNRPSEIHYINGYIVNLAKKHHINVPINQGIVNKIENLTNTTI